MTDKPTLAFTIGQGDWAAEIRRFAVKIDHDYWDGFHPVDEDELHRLEKAINRQLPDDYKLFMRTFGAGNFVHGGGLSNPDDVIAGCAGPLWMCLDSFSWATEEQHRQFYISRGKINPAPDKYTAAAIVYKGVNLLDLVQIGSDGSCNYHQLCVGTEPRPFGYCLLADGGYIEDAKPTFTDGLKNILIQHWTWKNIPEI
ncbi:MAG: SMI1/KNR4 family protein [Planctomycetaceae bacterium]|nr:MAG: SMI1/KNR4 family protein [Planctomycetaceae bacterium]